MIRNLPIRSKLIGILITPLLALTLLTSLGIGANLATKVQAERLRQQAAFAITLSRLLAGSVAAAPTTAAATWMTSRRASIGLWRPFGKTPNRSKMTAPPSTARPRRPCPH